MEADSGADDLVVLCTPCQERLTVDTSKAQWRAALDDFSKVHYEHGVIAIDQPAPHPPNSVGRSPSAEWRG